MPSALHQRHNMPSPMAKGHATLFLLTLGAKIMGVILRMHAHVVSIRDNGKCFLPFFLKPRCKRGIGIEKLLPLKKITGNLLTPAVRVLTCCSYFCWSSSSWWPNSFVCFSLSDLERDRSASTFSIWKGETE